MIPKKEGAVHIKDFSPISLVGYLYKLVAKVLALHLKRCISSVISASQNAFIPSRQLTDCSVLANEVIDVMRKENWDGLVCQINMQKAYGHVNWGYLDWALGQMGFGQKWRNWIKICTSSSTFSVLVNEVPKGFFKGSRGI